MRASANEAAVTLAGLALLALALWVPSPEEMLVGAHARLAVDERVVVRMQLGRSWWR